MRVLLTVLLVLIIPSLQAAYITDKLVAGLYKENKVSDKPLKALSSGTPLEVIERKDGFIKVRTSDGTIGWVEATYLTDEKPAKSLLLDTQAKLSTVQKQLDQLKSLQAEGASAGALEDLTALQEKFARAEGQVSQLELQLQAARVNIKNLEEEKALFNREKQKLLDDVKAGVQTDIDALEKANQALKQQILQAVNILNPEAVAAAGEKTTSTAKADPVIQKSPALILEKAQHGVVLWILVGLSLLAGIALGYFFMRHRVQQRFGRAFRL